MTTLPNQPVWELEADPGLLEPGPGALDRRPDVLVVGGGVTGLATAALCRRAGLGRVEVVERGRLAGGPSGRGGGILAPAPHHRTDPACLVSFGRASLDLWRQLSWEWEGELGLVPLDWLRPLPDGAPPASDLPPGAELLSPEDARDLEPRLDRKSTRLNSSHVEISYAVFCLKKKTKAASTYRLNRSHRTRIQT